MGKRNEDETTVEEAALALNVTPRTVINYIQAKEISAIKVGKSWHINKASLDAFKQRYGFAEDVLLSEPKGSENTEIKESQSSNFPKVSIEQKRKREVYPVQSLRLFQIAKDSLRNTSTQSLFPADRPDLKHKFLTLKAEALEYLGAGFYAFGSKSKAILYNRSREKVGGMLSLVYFYQPKEGKPPKDIQKIEEDLMPAFSSLIRKIEKKNERT